MNTDQLIDQLASNVPAIRPGAIGRRIAIGVALGLIVSTTIVILGMGVQPNLGRAMHGFSFWMKWGYTISLSVISIGATATLARPDASRARWLWLIAIPVVLLAMVGISELIHTPQTEWLKMWLGRSWMRCPWRVLALAMPIFIGLLWSFRTLAPTQLRAAGAVAGLAAGAFAATVYCLHCPEVSAIFVLTWYSLGIALAALAGSLIGPRLMRW